MLKDIEITTHKFKEQYEELDEDEISIQIKKQEK